MGEENKFPDSVTFHTLSAILYDATFLNEHFSHWPSVNRSASKSVGHKEYHFLIFTALSLSLSLCSQFLDPQLFNTLTDKGTTFGKQFSWQIWRELTQNMSVSISCSFHHVSRMDKLLIDRQLVSPKVSECERVQV